MKNPKTIRRRALDLWPRRVLSRNFHILPAAAALALGILSTSTASADVIAGWDTWDSVTEPTPSVTAAGITATATASGTGGNWTNADGSGRGSSSDGTWGTFNTGLPASSVTDVGPANLTLTNGKTDGELTLTIVNNGDTDLNLSAFHMDAVAFRPNAARTYALNVLEGSDITVGTVFTSEAPMNDNSTNAITQLGGGLSGNNQHDQIDLDLTGLADSTLEVGGTAVIQIAFSNGTGGGGGHHLFLDNVAVTTAPTTTDKLVLTSVPASATAATDFSVTVQAQDIGGSPLLVTQDTEISFVFSGTGVLSGNTGTILMGTSSVTLNSLQYDVAEDITLTAIKTSGDAILPSEASLPITINIGAASQIVIETAADGTGVPVTDQKLILGGTLDLFSISRDAGGNLIENVVATWSLENVTGDIVPGDLFDNGDGSAVFDPIEAGAANIRASFDSLSDGVSGLITAADLVNRYDGGTGATNPDWSNAINWEDDILPDFNNETDLFFFNDSITKRNSYLGVDVTVRSINFNEATTGNYINSFVLAGNALPANFTFDTDSEDNPAEFNVDALTETNITFGFSGAATADGRGVMTLADDLLVTHNGTGTLTLNGDILETDGSKGITKAGTGTLILSGTNSYTGPTTVNEGILRITGKSIADTGTLVIDGGVVDVEADEYVVELSIPGMANLPDGEYGSTDSGVTNPDNTNFTGVGKIIVGPPPIADVITITSITKTGDEEITIEFTSSGSVDVYGSTASDGFAWSLYGGNQPSGSYVDTIASADKTFYILVTAGDPAPADSP